MLSSEKFEHVVKDLILPASSEAIWSCHLHLHHHLRHRPQTVFRSAERKRHIQLCTHHTVTNVVVSQPAGSQWMQRSIVFVPELHPDKTWSWFFLMLLKWFQNKSTALRSVFYFRGTWPKYWNTKNQSKTNFNLFLLIQWAEPDASHTWSQSVVFSRKDSLNFCRRSFFVCRNKTTTPTWTHTDRESKLNRPLIYFNINIILIELVAVIWDGNNWFLFRPNIYIKNGILIIFLNWTEFKVKLIHKKCILYYILLY